MTRFKIGDAPFPSIHEIRKDLHHSWDPIDIEWECPAEGDLVDSYWEYHRGEKTRVFKKVKTDMGLVLQCEYGYETGGKIGIWH